MSESYIIKKAAHIPEKIFDAAWIIQLGRIEPFAFLSLIYSINHAMMLLIILLMNKLILSISSKTFLPDSLRHYLTANTPIIPLNFA